MTEGEYREHEREMAETRRNFAFWWEREQPTLTRYTTHEKLQLHAIAWKAWIEAKRIYFSETNKPKQ